MQKQSEKIDLYDEVSNPIDGLEDIMLRNDWIFERRTEDELTVQISGRMGEYKLAFVWQEEFCAMQFICAPDLRIHADHYEEAAQAINDINSKLWLGHFDMRLNTYAGHNVEENASDALQSTAIPCFRHTTLMRGQVEGSGVEPMEDLIDVALAECERYYMTFQLLSETAAKDANQLSFAMMDVAGSS
ncbi:MAG: YbjN domain-containing protein [Pseudomonadota bacterium]